MNEKEPEDVRELSEEDLKEAVGGRNHCYWYWDGEYWFWDAGLTTKACNERYLCPKCGGPLHFSWGFRYYCDPCNDSWYWEDSLIPNIKSKHYIRTTKADYDKWG